MSNLIPITKIYDIYPKYTFSKDVMRFMDDIVDIPRAEVFSKDEVIDMLTEIQLEIEELDSRAGYSGDGMPTFSTDYIRKKKVNELVQQKINAL